MANNFHEYKHKWLEIADGDFDYSIFFIKAWLPFNAWYCGLYPELNNTDSHILKKIKNENNAFKTRLVSILSNDDEHSIVFKDNIVKLHSLLESYNIPNNSNKISFKSVYFRDNPKKIFNERKNNIDYQIELLQTTQQNNIRVKATVIRNNNNINVFPYQHNKYDYNHFVNHNDFINLSNASRSILIKGFNEINPKKKESLIIGLKKDSLFGKNGVYFHNDVDLVAQSIIEILYRMRCVLFHGEIQPSKANLKIYEPAYHILRTLIKSLE